jgi:hypothetical protein
MGEERRGEERERVVESGERKKKFLNSYFSITKLVVIDVNEFHL